MGQKPKAQERRENLRIRLIDAAEAMIAAGGLEGLRARSLADEVGCAVGAIYNAVEDLDDLVFSVSARTLSALEGALIAAGATESRGADRDHAIAQLVRMSLAYLDFAAAQPQRWRAMFEHRLPEGSGVPDWYLADQRRLFDYVETPLRALRPDLAPDKRASLARSMFSALHGMVILGLEKKLEAVPIDELRQQITTVMSAMARGLLSLRP